MRVGVVAIQGDVSEHLQAFQRALQALGLQGTSVPVRRPPDLETVNALALPGGESTTIAKLLVKFGLFDRVVQRAREGMPLMGTCAGCILLAKEGDRQVEKTETRLLGLMDMAVDRNAFGRQRDSFEATIPVETYHEPFRAVFIRSPLITRTWGACRPLARIPEGIVLAEQGALIAGCFHPELTDDLRLHQRLLQKV